MTNPPQEEPKIPKSDTGLVVRVVSLGTGAPGFKPSSFHYVFLFGEIQGKLSALPPEKELADLDLKIFEYHYVARSE